METGFDAAKGAAEKILGVKFPVFMRLILPGLLATAVLYREVAWALGHLPPDPDHLWQRIGAYAALVLILGALISTANSETYKIYEGRTRWPRRLKAWAIATEQARVDRLRKTADSATTQADYDEAWYELRIYPLNDNGDPEATHPTRMGNILAGYEQYPNTRYGMDSVFYWPRIWLQIDKDVKEEIDSQWSVADGFLTLSAISYSGAAIWLTQALVGLFRFGLGALPFASVRLTMLASAGWLVLGYFWYRMGLPFHRENGEAFKSIFDVYREKARNMTSFNPNEKETWTAAWAYLQYLVMKCPNCRQYTSRTDQCDKCGFGLTERNKSFRDSGKFPTG